jgi:hypothetical protein
MTKWRRSHEERVSSHRIFHRHIPCGWGWRRWEGRGSAPFGFLWFPCVSPSQDPRPLPLFFASPLGLRRGRMDRAALRRPAAPGGPMPRRPQAARTFARRVLRRGEITPGGGSRGAAPGGGPARGMGGVRLPIRIEDPLLRGHTPRGEGARRRVIRLASPGDLQPPDSAPLRTPCPRAGAASPGRRPWPWARPGAPGPAGGGSGLPGPLPDRPLGRRRGSVSRRSAQYSREAGPPQLLGDIGDE